MCLHFGAEPYGSDVVIVVPPPSPSDTNPPLGPALLKAAHAARGFTLAVVDFNILHLTGTARPACRRASATLGDQDKNRAVTRAAIDTHLSNVRAVDEWTKSANDNFATGPTPPLADALGYRAGRVPLPRNRTLLIKARFLAENPLAAETPQLAVCGVNPILGCLYDFGAVERASFRATHRGHPWRRLIEDGLFAPAVRPLRMVGLSIMGPAQVVPALAVARMARERWPGVVMLAGGSHITLLEPEIRGDARYGRLIDGFLPGHSEELLADVVSALQAGRDWQCVPGVVGAGAGDRGCASGLVHFRKRFRILPEFDPADLRLYDPSRVTLPLQLTRGCSFGDCSMCTYTAVERHPTKPPSEAEVVSAITALIDRTGVRRFSLKDSYFTAGWVRSLARTVVKSALDIEWSATTMLRAELDAELLRLLAASGCRTLEFGLETIHPRGQEPLQKPQDLTMVQRIIADAAAAGIVSVVNLIYGLPDETHDQARAQLRWFRTLQARHPGCVEGSHNLLEVNRRSPFAEQPDKFGIRTRPTAPWAFALPWNAPAWHPDFRPGAAA